MMKLLGDVEKRKEEKKIFQNKNRLKKIQENRLSIKRGEMYYVYSKFFYRC